MAEILYLTNQWDSKSPKITYFGAVGDMELKFGGEKIWVHFAANLAGALKPGQVSSEVKTATNCNQIQVSQIVARLCWEQFTGST
eukprot:424097-Pelagomonas_calceolata.AAC.5